MRQYTDKLQLVKVEVTFREETIHNIFRSVQVDDWYADAVKYVCDNGLNGVFEPKTVYSRTMVVTVLYRIEGEPDVGDNGGFTDIPIDFVRLFVVPQSGHGTTGANPRKRCAPGNAGEVLRNVCALRSD